ncbi:hypothetical protein KJ673_03650 [Patescibacteria group bacterium]|nr:hypothetical protein [Patescibacteria group bacterium]MCG2687397.1 hypothetical protein [Candidatus Parcubacteria bacterium]
MKSDKEHAQQPSARSAFICGTTAILLAQGCAENLRMATDDEIDIVHEIALDGRESILPVIKGLARVANPDLIYGYDGVGSYPEFSIAIDGSADRLEEMIDGGQIKMFNDPDYHASAFFLDHDAGGDALNERDYIAFNLSYLDIVPPLEIYENDGITTRANYGTSLHEASHEVTKHSDIVNEYETYMVEERPTLTEQADALVVQERDFAFLLSLMTDQLETFRENNYINDIQIEYARQWLNGARQTLAIYQNGNYSQSDIDKFKQDCNEYLEGISTSEGFAEKVVGSEGIPFVGEYWDIPLEEQVRVIGKSSWYDEFVGKEMQEIVSEARRELGLEFVEAEPREIDQGSMWELHKQRQQEMDGYEHERHEKMNLRG